MKLTVKLFGKQRTIDTARSAAYNARKCVQLGLIGAAGVVVAGAALVLNKR